MTAMAYPALATLLAVFLYSVLMMNAGRCRGKYGIAAPAVTGHEGYERAYRTQMNTLEHMMVFLPALWLFAYTVDATWAFGLGLLWIAGRIAYAIAYLKNPKKRGPGLIVAFITQAILLLGALYGVALLFVK
ncbi:MAG: hypothetical protein CMM52_02880 [Rhodospirillaceae bacterium]|nr:hypothetical protein [Rhodospirillaceae bacterium]|tara:strand:+ start:6734 stop:7129 length:396 start_codon:yes stop_codon:yes gene_type:complete